MEQARAARVEPSAGSLRVAGHRVPGDGGGGLYRLVAEPPGHAGKFRSADGRWWELAESWVCPEHLGARGDGVADDTEAVAAWLRFLAGRVIGFLPPRTTKRYRCGPIRVDGLSNVVVHGGGRSAAIFQPRDPRQEFVLAIGESCAHWELTSLGLYGNNHPVNDQPRALLISEGTQINLRGVTLESAEVGLWFRSGGYCVCQDLFIASCRDAYLRTGGRVDRQFSESNFSDVIFDARFNTDPRPDNYRQVLAPVNGTGLDIDFGSAFLKFDHITGAGMEYGMVIHDSHHRDAWPIATTCPDGVYCTDLNFDWTASEAFRIDNAALVEVDRAWLRSLRSYAASVRNFRNLHLANFGCYASHEGGLHVAGSFHELALQHPRLAGNSWPENVGGNDLSLDGAPGSSQGIVKVAGGEIACAESDHDFPVNGVTNRSSQGIVASPAFSARLIVDGVTIRGHSTAATSGLIGRPNTTIRGCDGLTLANQGVFCGSTDKHGHVWILHGLTHGRILLVPRSAIVALQGRPGQVAMTVNQDQTHVQIAVLDQHGNGVPHQPVTIAWLAMA